jgi:putative flippase GtrA
LGGKLGRFTVVGIANTAIDLVVFSICLHFLEAPLVANFIAWGIAVLFSFAANLLWSFERKRETAVASSFFRFVSLGALISLGVSNLWIALFAGSIGVWPAKLLGVIVAAALNFIAARWSIEGRLIH